MFIVLIVYSFFVFIRPQDYMPQLEGLPIMPVLLIVMVVGFFITKDKQIDFPQDKFLIAFFLVALLSHLLNGYMSGLLGTFLKILPIILLYFVMTNTLITMERLEKYFALVIAFSLIMALHGIYQTYNGGIGWTGAEFAKKTTRITYIGIFNDPNDLSQVFIFSLPLVVYFIYSRPSKLLRLLNIAILIIVLYGVSLTGSRGAILSLASMIGFYALKKYGFKKGLIAGVILLIPLLFLAKSQFSAMSADEESAYGRIEAWYEGFQMLIHSPIWGVGPGMFTEYHHLTAHNSYVLCFAETGLLGYFFWLGMLFFVFLGLSRSAVYELADSEDESVLSPSFFLSISLIGFLTASFFLSRTYTIILYINMGIISSYLYTMKNTYGWELYDDPLPKFIIIIIGLMLLSLIVIFFFMRFTV